MNKILKRYFSLRFLFLVSAFCCLANLSELAAQYSVNLPDTLKKTVVRLNIFRPGVSLEHELTFGNTIVVDAGVSILPVFDSINNKYHVFVYPVFKGEFRHYYNFSRRAREGKSINRFSGSYVGLVYNHLVGDRKRVSIDQAGAIWGFQYVSLKRIHLGLNLGFGYSYYSDIRYAPGFEMIGDFRFGYTF